MLFGRASSRWDENPCPIGANLLDQRANGTQKLHPFSHFCPTHWGVTVRPDKAVRIIAGNFIEQWEELLGRIIPGSVVQILIETVAQEEQLIFRHIEDRGV